MVYNYPHQRRRIVTISGIFDAFVDVDISKVKWHETWKTGNMQWDVLSAPGGVGGNALWMKGTIGDTIGMQGVGHLSSYPNISNQYLNPPDKPFRVKNRAEFRMRIVQDQSSSNNLLGHCAGFVLDGAVKWTDTHNIERTSIQFSVANQRVGIASGPACLSMYDVAWAGAVDTYYNVRIEWEFDWFAYSVWNSTDWYRNEGDLRVFIKVYINNSLILDSFIYKAQWRDDGLHTWSKSMDFGRAGIGVHCENTDTANVTNGTFVEAYFKDILITQDIKPLNWVFDNSVIHRGAKRACSVFIYSNFPDTIQRGQDIQIHARNKLTDDWTGQFRGIIRSVAKTGNLITLGAEGYESVLASEKSEALSFTAKTAKEIITDAVNVPLEKPIFDVTTFFDTATTTYNREYPNEFKLDIMLEMTILENFTLYLDMANAWHFEEYTNSRLFTDIHFEYGIHFGEYSDDDIFLRNPNIVRVVGSGFMAQKEIAAESFVSGSTVVREISRLDLTTQAEVDDALAYYLSAYLEPTKIIKITVPINYAVTPSKFLKVTIPELGYNYQHAFVLSVSTDLKGKMTITLLSIASDITAFIGELNYRQSGTEGADYPQDLVSNNIMIEGVATLNIAARFYIREAMGSPISDDVVYREGKAVVTNKFIEDLIDLFMTDDVPSQPNGYDYIHWGTGTTPAKEDDTGIETAGGYAWVGPYRNLDGSKGWGVGAGLGSELIAVQFRIPEGDISSMANCTELTLQETTSTTSKTAVRATFESFTPTNATNVEIYIVIFFISEPGVCSPVGHQFCHSISQWCRELGVLFPKPKRIAFFGTDTFTAPSIWLDGHTESGGVVVTCPSLASQVTLNITTIKQKFMIKYQQSYIFEYDDRFNTGSGDKLVAWIGTAAVDNDLFSSMNIFFRTTKSLLELDGVETDITIWLKFARKDVDIRNWKCTPRIEEGDCL